MSFFIFFFFNDTATTEIYTLSLHDALPISFTARDWRDLQLLSQLVWMEESWFQKNEVVSRLAAKGKDYTENDKSALRGKQLELLRLILPAYRDAASRGQIEISTTPFYHPILPLLCDSDIARVANPR